MVEIGTMRVKSGLAEMLTVWGLNEAAESIVLRAPRSQLKGDRGTLKRVPGARLTK
jgi:hypothetical protein